LTLKIFNKARNPVNQWIKTSGLYILFFLIPVLVSAQRQKTKPNIIYIYADDLGYGELGSYGQTKMEDN